VVAKSVATCAHEDNCPRRNSPEQAETGFGRVPLYTVGRPGGLEVPSSNLGAQSTKAPLRRVFVCPGDDTGGSRVCNIALRVEVNEAVREAVRLFPEDERLREEERQLLDLQAQIAEHPAVLAA
jgi:hypothetical protein